MKCFNTESVSCVEVTQWTNILLLLLLFYITTMTTERQNIICEPLEKTCWESHINQFTTNKRVSLFYYYTQSIWTYIRRIKLLQWIYHWTVFSFHPLLHDSSKKGHGVYYPIGRCLLIKKISLFPISQSTWSLALCQIPIKA